MAAMQVAVRESLVAELVKHGLAAQTLLFNAYLHQLSRLFLRPVAPVDFVGLR
jgi:hypothetical protein